MRLRFSFCHFFRLLLKCGSLFAGAVSLVAGGVDTALPEGVLPELKPILERAVAQSPQMIQRNLDVAQAEASQINARSLLLPSFGGYVSYAQSHSQAGSAPANTAQGAYYGFNLNQPLYHWGTLKAQQQSAKIGVLIAEKNFAEAYRQLALQIRSQYLGLIVQKKAAGNARQAAELAQTVLDDAEAKARTGQIADRELLLAKLARDEAVLARDQTAGELAQAIRLFATTTGGEPLALEQIPPSLPPVSVPAADTADSLITKFLGDGIEQTSQAQIYRYAIDQANLAYKVAKYRLYPKVNLGMSYGLTNSTDVGTNGVSQSGVTTTTISVNASWNIFDGFATKAAKLSSLTTRRSSQNQYDNYLRSVSQQVRDLAQQLTYADRSASLADARWNMAKQDLALKQDELARGLVSPVAVETMVQSANGSELAAISARAELMRKWAEFVSALNLDPVLQSYSLKEIRHAK